MNQAEVKRLYRDICRGYSCGKLDSSTVFFKHLTPIDYLEVEEIYQERLLEAQELGMLKFQDRLTEIIDFGLWPEDEEKRIKSIQRNIDQMEMSKLRAINYSTIKETEKIIEEYKLEIYQIEFRRAAIIGQTAEWFANNASLDKRIEISFYSDESLKQRLFSRDEIEYMEKERADKAINLLNSFDNELSQQNIRYLSVQPFFQNVFSLCSPLDFFKKKGYELTNYQINLASYAEYFKKWLKDCAGMDYESKCDPDKIEAFVIEKNNKLDHPQSGDSDDPIAKMKKMSFEGELPEN